MKICWENLEKIEYRPDRGDWQDKKWKNIFYVYKEFCEKCGEPFLSSKGSYFCNYSCSNCRNHQGKNNTFYNKHHTKETKQKISESLKKLYSNIENHPMYNKKHSVKTIINISGENSIHWKGGISCEPYCDIWVDKEYKESIKERDGYQCLNPVCSKESNRLCIHHINYNKKDCEPNNLITLCNSCNIKANFDREWHEAWYSTIIYNRSLK